MTGGSVLLLGGGRGIGRSMSHFFLEAGVPLFWVTRTRESLASFMEEVSRTNGPLLLAEAFDICDRGRSLSFVSRLFSAPFSGLSPVLVIHNAGFLSAGRHNFMEEDEEETDRMLDVNFLAPLFWSGIFSRSFLNRREGGHLFLSSSVGRLSRAGWGSYGIAKGALEALSSQLAAELPSPLYSLTVNPGPVATQMRRQAYPDEDPSSISSPEEAGKKLVAFCLKLMDGKGRSFNGAKVGREDLG